MVVEPSFLVVRWFGFWRFLCSARTGLVAIGRDQTRVLNQAGGTKIAKGTFLLATAAQS
jgi:hypothetical protein